MFGLTQQEMDLYNFLVQDFAIRDVTPIVVSKSKFITPLMDNGKGKKVPNSAYVNQLVQDIETIITITAMSIAMEYAHLQAESEKSEKEIIEYLHTKYEDHLVMQFIRYGVTFSTDVLSEIIGEIIIELPYLYINAIEDENFNEDSFLEEKMEAYSKYLDDNFNDFEFDFDFDKEDDDE